MTSSHAILTIPPGAYQDIARTLHDAGIYEDFFLDDGRIIMHGMAVKPDRVDQPRSWHVLHGWERLPLMSYTAGRIWHTAHEVRRIYFLGLGRAVDT